MSANKKPKGLRDRVEVIENPAPAAADEGLDADVLAYVNKFLDSPIPPLEHFSLETPEAARKALIMLEKTQSFLNERMRTAQILKAMCKAEGGVEPNVDKDEALH